MTDNRDDEIRPDESVAAEEFLASFASSRVEPVLDEMTSGFTVEHARRILASPKDLKHFLGVAERTRPGRGWLAMAAEDSERGRLNRQLLTHALAARKEPEEVYAIERGEDCTVVRPRWWSPDLPPEQEAPARVDGGWIIHDPRDISKAPAAKLLDGYDAWWLPEIVGEAAADALSEQRAAAPLPHEPTSPEATAVARLALGLWLRRWHPGTGSRRNGFDEDLLQMELGLLAWHGQYCFASPEPVRRLLKDLGPTIVDRYVQIQDWTGWRRRLADDVVALATRAYVETVPEDAPGHAGVARLRESNLHAESQLSSSDLAESRIPASRADVALAAGDGTGTSDATAHGSAVVDPLQVAPRSVAAMGQPVVWEWSPASGGELRITVAPGESPAEFLVARVLLADERRDVTLSWQDGVLVGSCPLDVVPPDMVIDVCSPEFAVPPRPPEAAEECRAWIRHVLDARTELFADGRLAEWGIDPAELPDRPFLAEIAAWETTR